GGERQRIAFAKTLVAAPKLMLLDEPFSNLDAIHRGILKSVIYDIELHLNTSCILVSHDPTDLLSWADEIIILDRGKIIQKGAPAELYNHPVNEYAAALFGKYNTISPELVRRFPSLEKEVRRFIRPGEFVISFESTSGIEGVVKSSSFMGAFHEAEIDLSGYPILVVTEAPLLPGDVVYVSRR
ncbi:MAG: ABC transporter ATP-binding protein, partial [Flavisolibacter sp.]